jgi:hypothetical protein
MADAGGYAPMRLYLYRKDNDALIISCDLTQYRYSGATATKRHKRLFMCVINDQNKFRWNLPGKCFIIYFKSSILHCRQK